MLDRTVGLVRHHEVPQGATASGTPYSNAVAEVAQATPLPSIAQANDAQTTTKSLKRLSLLLRYHGSILSHHASTTFHHLIRVPSTSTCEHVVTAATHIMTAVPTRTFLTKERCATQLNPCLRRLTRSLLPICHNLYRIIPYRSEPNCERRAAPRRASRARKSMRTLTRSAMQTDQLT